MAMRHPRVIDLLRLQCLEEKLYNTNYKHECKLCRSNDVHRSVPVQRSEEPPKLKLPIFMSIQSRREQPDTTLLAMPLTKNQQV